MKAPKTPCIGICSTTSLGDHVCRGCRRFSFEVIKWNSYGPQEKKAVLQRIEKLVSQIFQNRFHIQSETLEVRAKRFNVLLIRSSLLTVGSITYLKNVKILSKICRHMVLQSTKIFLMFPLVS